MRTRCRAKSNETPRCAERSALLRRTSCGQRSRISARRKSHFTGSREGQVTRASCTRCQARAASGRNENKRSGRAYITRSQGFVRDAPMSSRRTDVDALRPRQVSRRRVWAPFSFSLLRQRRLASQILTRLQRHRRRIVGKYTKATPRLETSLA